MMRTALLIAALLALTACGFQPVHGRAYRAQQDLDLSSVRIETNTSRLGQLLKAEIERGANPDYERAEKLYTLQVQVAESEIYLFVNPDGTAGRGDIEYRSTYQLVRNLDRKAVAQGNIIRTASYNISETADYATYVSEEDARKRGIIELAQDYKLRMANLLAQLNAKTGKE